MTLLLFLGGSLGAAAKLAPEQVEKLPTPATHTVDFSLEIRPILESRCVNCHGHGRDKGGFLIDNRETFLKGGDSGPAVVPGKSAESYLVELVSGLDPDNVMPQKGTKLSAAQVGLLRAWIDQGVKWDSAITFARAPALNLKPAEPKIPAGPAALNAVNGIDLLLKSYFAEHHVVPGPPVSDRTFARRVYLDVIGLLPAPEELAEFVKDERPDKRERLVERLLANNQRYAEHWLTFWNDLLRNDYKGTGYIDDGRKQITHWLYSALAKNMPFDRFVAELVNPTAESEGFVNGIVWRGVVNASQMPHMQAAQNISQVFMGVNLKCASCHDSFINDWTLADSYGLASIYADGELEMVRCDKPTGQKAQMKFLYPELGSIDPKAPKPARLEQLAKIITQKQNGRLSRTVVNRLWAKFMGRGLVEPLDDMEQRAWNSDVLDWLAADLVGNGYDLKRTIARILKSQAYQMACVPGTEQASKDFVFRGPSVRRLTAEQFQDALSRVTGVWSPLPANTQTDFSAGQPASAMSQLENPARLKWIWNDSAAADKASAGTVFFRKEVSLLEKPTEANAVISCDNKFKLFVNGQDVQSGQDHTKPKVVNLLPYLRAGENLLAISGINEPAAPDKKEADQSSPAGLLFYARIRHERAEGEVSVIRVWDVASDASWSCATNRVDDWQKPEFKPADWSSAIELGDAGLAPWKLDLKFAQALSAAGLAGHVRAALVASDPLMTALGRPNREQVTTVRASSATTLQALELMNGKTLTQELERGSQELLAEKTRSTQELVTRVFERALARPPNRAELELAQGLVGSPAKKEGIEDLLWVMAMLPEFQMIY